MTRELKDLEGASFLHVSANLMDPEAPGQVVDRAIGHFGVLDILVNNAGRPPPGITRLLVTLVHLRLGPPHAALAELCRPRGGQ